MESDTTANLPEDRNAAAAVLLGRVAEDDDRTAFAELYDRVGGALFATILTIVRDQAEAEDMLQECFCAIWDHADQYDPERGKVISWMMTIARNKCFDHLAKAKRRGKLTDRMMEKGSADTNLPEKGGFDATAANEESAAVHEALNKLPEDQRQAIQLAFLKGMSQSEVAKALGQPLGTVKARIRRGLYHLRGVLQPYLIDPTH